MNLHQTIWAGKIPGRLRWPGVCLSLTLLANAAWAQTNAVAVDASATGSMTGAGASILRVFGAFLLVTAIFFAGVWLVRNWQRFAFRKGGAPRLNVIEVKSLGQRQAIYVVGYDQQRMLLASSPAGITLVSHLPNADEEPAAVEPARPNFAEAFRQVLSRKA